MVWIYWLLGTTCYFYQFVFRTIFGTLGDDVSSKFQMSITDLSTFFAAGMLAYPLMQIPAGILLDKYGARKMLTAAIGCLSVGILLLSMTTSFPLAICGRILMGVGSAFCFIGTSKIVTVWFPLKMMGFLLGTTVFLGGMGAAFSKHLYDALPSHWGFDTSLLVMGLFGIVLAFMIGTLLREKKNASVGAAGNIPTKQTTFIQDLRFILSNKQILYAALFTFFGYLPISAIADSWGPIAFQNMFGVSKEIADKTVLYFYIPFAIGSLFYSSLTTTVSKIRYVLMFEFSFASLFLYLLLNTNLGFETFFGVPGFLILTGLLGFNLGGVALAFPIGCSHASNQISGTIVGVMNMFCMVSGGLFSKLMGHFLHFYWDGSLTQEGLPIFSGAAYKSSLQPLILTTVLSVLLLLIIRSGKEDEDAEAVPAK